MEKIQTNTVVIGAGPGGYAAAIRLGQLGVDTVLIEKEAMGGTCLNKGCIPSKSLLHASGMFADLQKKETQKMGIHASNATIAWPETIAWKDQVVQKLVEGIHYLLKSNHVRTIEGGGTLASANRVQVSGKTEPSTIACENVILAMGSRIVNLPDFPVNHRTILDSTDLLSLKEIPPALIILGGGVIGMELGTVYANLGSAVTIVEVLDRILLNCEAEASRIVAKEFKKMGGTILTKTKALSVREQTDGIELACLHKEKKKVLQADLLAVTVGRAPNFEGIELGQIHFEMDQGRIKVNDSLLTSQANIYAIGDLIPGPMLAHKAAAEGVMAAEAIAGKKVSRSDIWAIPDVVYTKPEIATVGLSEEQAKAQGYQLKQGKFLFTALGRAATTNEGLGYIKYIADCTNDRILGASIVSSKASELISEATLAIEMGATLEDIALTVHPHPTFGEGHMEAAAAGLRKAIHIPQN